MADQDRRREDGDRTRFGDDPRSRRGFDEYGRRGDYGAGDRDRPGGGYGARRYSEGYGDFGRSFERDRSAADRGGDEAYAGDERYGGQWGRGPTAMGGGYPGQDYSGPYGLAEDYPRAQGYGGEDYRGQGSRGDQDRTWMERAGERVASWFGGGERERTQGHRGKGPKNYVRSDDRVREEVNDRLTDDMWLDASGIEVTVASGEVTLSGTVSARDDKRRAEDLVEQVSGVRHVQNNLRVQPHDAAPQTYFGAGPTA